MPALVRLRRILAMAAVAWLMGGCSAFQGDIFDGSFWSVSPLVSSDAAEFGLAELAKGNYVTAEGHFRQALRSNPKDVHALIGLGLLYQDNGQVTKAREMYEAVLAIRPDDSQQFVVWNSIATKPVSQIASVNLSLLDTGGAPAAQAAAAAPMVEPVAPAPVGGAPTSSTMLGRAAEPSVQVSSAGSSPLASMAGAAPVGAFAGSDANVVSRFATLRALRDQGLVTDDEYRGRRTANLGALLQLTAPPPSAGLNRPVPTTEQISGRLRAIGRALEMRAITVSQHGAERAMILDALLPSAPVVVDNPPPPPQGLMQAADMVRRLEQLRDGGYISSDEYSRERQAIELAMRPSPPKAPPAQAMAKRTTTAPKQMTARPSGPAPAVHLASYRSVKQAARGWAQIRRAHAKLLQGLDHDVSKVNLGRKGTYYRLKVGPLPDAAAAKALCGKLKRRRQFCEPTMMGG